MFAPPEYLRDLRDPQGRGQPISVADLIWDEILGYLAWARHLFFEASRAAASL